MKNLYIFVVCLLCLPSFVNGQTVNEILYNPDYICGVGQDNTDANADAKALADLMGQIKVTVKSFFKMSDVEQDNQEGVNGYSTVESIVQTYSRGSLPNARKLVVSNQPNAFVVRYISQLDLQQMFKEREYRSIEFVCAAQAAMAKGRVDDALRYFYWGLCLVKSLPHPSSVRHKVDGVERMMVNWIPQQMNDIFSNLDIRIIRQEGAKVDLYVTYEKKPVTSLDFRFMNGQHYSNICSARNGIAQIEFLSDANVGQVQLKYEYEFLGQARSDEDLEQSVEAFIGTPFPKATIIISQETKKEMKHLQECQQKVESENSIAIETLEVKRSGKYVVVIESLLKAIKEKNYLSVKPYFTNDGYRMFETLIHYGNASIVGTPKFSFYEALGKVICRSIPMRFAFQHNVRTFNEDVTFTFNEDGKIESLAFALDQTSRNDIFCKEAWPDSVRMQIASFLENYQTAFALKRIDYIRDIFSDNAIIITGCVVKPAKATIENTKYINNEYVRYTRQNKEQYLKNLERCFYGNQYINLRLTDNEIRKLAKDHGEAYGILIHQDYYSSSYSDTGYLYLIVDFNDPNQPIIQLRTWQPKRDPNISNQYGRDYKYWGLLNFGSF